MHFYLLKIYKINNGWDKILDQSQQSSSIGSSINTLQKAPHEVGQSVQSYNLDKGWII